MATLTSKEKDFTETVRGMDYKRGGAFVLSAKGKVYHGIPFETAVRIHGEENAIGAMLTAEGTKAKLEMVLVVGAPGEIIMPCGRCLVAIKRYGAKDAVVLCADKSLKKVRRFTISQLYPKPCDEKWLFD